MDLIGMRKSSEKYRTHGKPSSPNVSGVPTVEELREEDKAFKHVTHTQGGCPVCGTKRVFRVTVDLEENEHGATFGVYAGCAACPWASPMQLCGTAPHPC
ncbi:hypothetical protein CMI37_17550 [Candidatus Pacearchaeota archaeon]|jgi:hypothetical protein|nr:hypothetical protein [Candidatus Pacearchaeota archaeon]|tara:strand:- start:3262 stop:3561 length:300 start_codon:yes stop_codon:yes gene_type:complete